MNMPIQPLSCSGYRFPAVIISHGTWLYFRFPLSDTRHYRYVERAPNVRLAVDAGQHVAADAFRVQIS